MKITYNVFHYDVISRRLIIHAHGNEYLRGLQLRSSHGRAATDYGETYSQSVLLSMVKILLTI